MELVHKSNRAFIGVIFNSSFAVGACFVAIYGYFIRDIVILQTLFAMHALILFTYFWYKFFKTQLYNVIIKIHLP